MFSIGIVLMGLGYAVFYVGIANLNNGFTGPTIAQAMGMTTAVAPAGADSPNLTGQPPSTSDGGPRIKGL